MIVCEQCGNDFKYGKLVVKEDKELILCPYCRWLNPKPKRRKKGGKR